mmetsp:Transcript_7286/g.13682  ORF Transcript_7286/g.13682 Transcript_7286/m.13682 type:complete len:524 (-) Transcript_7286:166-1737(-)
MFSPEMMRMAQEQMSRMTPEQMAQMQQQMSGMSPDMMQQAMAQMKNMSPDDMKTAQDRMNQMSPDDIAKATEQAGSMSSQMKAQQEYTYKASVKLKTDGNYMVGVGQYAEASEKYVRAINNLKDHATPASATLRMSCQLNLALCYVKLGKNDDAISTCTDALRVDPDSLKATYRRGQAYQAKGALDLALADLKRAHSIAPADETVEQSYKELKAKIDSEGSVSEEAVRKAESKLEDERKAAAEAKKKEEEERAQLKTRSREQWAAEHKASLERRDSLRREASPLDGGAADGTGIWDAPEEAKDLAQSPERQLKFELTADLHKSIGWMRQAESPALVSDALWQQGIEFYNDGNQMEPPPMQTAADMLANFQWDKPRDYGGDEFRQLSTAQPMSLQQRGLSEKGALDSARRRSMHDAMTRQASHARSANADGGQDAAAQEFMQPGSFAMEVSTSLRPPSLMSRQGSASMLGNAPGRSLFSKPPSKARSSRSRAGLVPREAFGQEQSAQPPSDSVGNLFEEFPSGK